MRNYLTYPFKSILYIVTYVLGVMHVNGQQDPAFTQYMYNMNIINPAYVTGAMGTLNVGALYRNQWLGADGAPTTMTGFVHTPMSENVELGLSFIKDEIGNGALNEQNIMADFAYVIPIGYEFNLSFGLKAGVITFDTQFSDFQLNSGDFTSDPAFSENLNSLYYAVGSGIFFYGDNFYVGASIPNFLRQKHLEDRNGVQFIGAEEIHGFLTSGYVYEINRDVLLKPSVMARFVPNAPISFDINANVLFNERFEVGVSHRWQDSFAALVNVAITPSIRLGYAYDYTTSNLGNFNSGTHEVMVLFDLSLSRRKSFVSPRFF